MIYLSPRDPPFLPEMSTTKRNGFPLRDNPLEVLVSGSCLPDRTTKTTPTDLSSTLSPTSKGEGGSSREYILWWPPSRILSQLVRIGLIRPGRSHRESGGCAGTNTTDKSCPGQGVFSSGITGRLVPLSGLPRPNTVRPHWWLNGKSLNIFATLTQSVTLAFSPFSLSHYTPEVTNPIRNTNLCGFSSLWQIDPATGSWE